EGNAGTQIMIFTVTSSAAVQDGFTVAFSASHITTSSSDYAVTTPSPLSFTGTAGENQVITVAISRDAVVEPHETFRITLGAVVGATPVQAAAIPTGASGTGTIANDDTARLSVNDISASESGTFTFTISSDKVASQAMTVLVNTASGTATL